MIGLFLTLGKMIPPLRLAGRALLPPVLAGVTVTVAPGAAHVLPVPAELDVLDALVLVLVLGLRATRTLVSVHPYTPATEKRSRV